MKTIILLTVVLVMIMPVAVFSEEPVDFPDPNLKACIREHLHLGPTDPDPTPTDMLALTFIAALSFSPSDNPAF